MSGGSKKQTVGYKYYAGMHMVLCHGPIDNISQIVVDEKELWAGSTGSGQLTIDEKELFGGESREGGISGTLDVLMGEDTQTQNDYLVSKLGSLVPSFRGVVSVVLRQFYLSMNPYIKPWSFRIQRIHTRDGGLPQWEDGYSQIDVTVYDEDGSESTAAAMNPAHIIRECLTNELWGMGYNEDDIDDTAFLSSAITFYDEGMGMSLLWDTQTSIEEFIKIVLQHVDASIYVDRKTGKFTLKPIRGGYDESELLVLDESNVDKVEDFKRPVFGELANSITVNYWDYTDDSTGSITVQDIALQQEQGGENATTVTYEGFIDPATASKAAQRDLTTLSTPLISCTIYATKVARDLNIGDVFIWSWPDYQIASVVMRVTGIAYGNGQTRRVRIQCVQDVFSYPADAFVSKPPTGWVNPNGPPGAVIQQLAFEFPYYDLVRDNGQTVVDNQIETNPYVGYAGIACTAPITTALNALMYTDDGSDYEEVDIVDFCGGAFLSTDLSYLTTVIPLIGATALDEVEVGDWVQVGSELMGIEAISLTEMTVKRGVLDTVPTLHTAGEEVLFWDGYAGQDPTEYVSSDIVNIKVVAANGSGVYPLADATAETLTIVGRAAKPFFAPGQFKVNGIYYPEEEFGGSLSLTWAHRNRVFQTGGEMLGFIDDAITSEEGGNLHRRRLRQVRSIGFDRKRHYGRVAYHIR